MCGIVVYYGDAQNHLTRILTGMWAIVYRAPDSTGIGLLGNDLEPLKIRRELGSVENLIDRILVEPVFDETGVRAVAALEAGDCEHFIAARQAALLAFEGFSVPGTGEEYPGWSALTDTQTVNTLHPGTPGNPRIAQTFHITSPGGLKQVINRLISDFDLPLTVVEKLILRGFEAQAALQVREQPLEKADLIREFRQIFNKHAGGITGLCPRRKNQTREQKHPFIRKYVWQILRRVVVILPPDFTTDGVTLLFRNLESCMLTSHTGDTAERIQTVFNSFWNKNKHDSQPKWQTLFAAEKAANVYGLAAAAAMACFQTQVYVNRNGASGNGLPLDHVPGVTHPLLLRYMNQPVIGQGRWAIQSAVSVRNAHPFTDRDQKRAVVLNGQFDSRVETRVQAYLTQVAGYPLRTENSTELFAMLWGHYFDTTCRESQRYLAIEEQRRLGLEEISISSQSIDYTIFKNLAGKSIHQLDEMAFIRAVETMIPSGGQFAVSGISRVSPDRLFLAAHNRPVYIVKRLDTDDFMVVSDINAALGLFDQVLIQSTSRRLQRLMQTYSKKSVIVEPDFFDQGPDVPPGEAKINDDWFKREKMKLLAPFRVAVYALEGPRIFAAIYTRAGSSGVIRELDIRDFSGKKRRDIRPEQTLLTPVAFQKDFNTTFYEEHLQEIPGLLRDILDRYLNRVTGLPEFDIRVRMIKKRFGNNLADLNRIILVATGFSYALAGIVKKTMAQFFTGINIVAATPLEITKTFINPDRDLVVMMSWSGTTSDMIDAAAGLLKHNVLMVGVTEKPFSDLALVVRKSAGVVPVFSGEEVTVVPLKSAVCMLMVLDLFCLWLSAAKPEQADTAAALAGEMGLIPGCLAALSADEAVETFCRETAWEHQNTRLHYIVDAFHDTGSAKIGALNLEVNAWTSIGHTLDYSALSEFMDSSATGNELILVNATTHKRIDEAIAFMKALKDRKIAFVAAGTFSHEQSRVEELAGRAVILPDLPDYFQPFVDLPFMFLFGFYYGLAQGRLAGEMPRNLAKSVTAGRIKGRGNRSAADILDDLEEKEAAFVFPLDMDAEKTDCYWAQKARNAWETEYYRDLIRLGRIFHTHDPFAELLGSNNQIDFSRLSRLIFRYLAEDGIMIFVPMDPRAEAACRNFIRLWEPFLDIPLQVEPFQQFKGVSTEGSLVVTVASQTVPGQRLAPVVKNAHAGLLWIGPGTPGSAHAPFAASCGACFFEPPARVCAHDYLYAALTLFFCRVTAKFFPKIPEQLLQHFKQLLPLLMQMLDSRELFDRISWAVRENQTYEKCLFVSGFQGNAISWQTAAGNRAPRGVACEPFGVSTYHHLVLVDPRVSEKFVKIEPRETMLAQYPSADIHAWEERYLGGVPVDKFVQKAAMPFQADAVLPFRIDDQWFLPVQNPRYDTGLDCLVTIDATSESQFDTALDELAVFGSRYARIIVITQEGFAGDSRLADLKKYPVSHLILLPGPVDRENHPMIWSDFLMPVAVNLVGTAMAWSRKQKTGNSKEQVDTNTN